MKNVGTEVGKKIIIGVLREHEYRGKGAHGAVADEIMASIFEAYQISGDVEDEVQKDIRLEYVARGGDPKIVKIYDRLCKSLWLDFLPLTPQATEVYQWIAEQEKNGQKIEDFGEWAREPERIAYVRKYRRNAGDIKIDWIVAFDQKKQDRMLADDERV